MSSSNYDSKAWLIKTRAKSFGQELNRAFIKKLENCGAKLKKLKHSKEGKLHENFPVSHTKFFKHRERLLTW